MPDARGGNFDGSQAGGVFEFEMELVVERGRGYVPSEINKTVLEVDSANNNVKLR